MFATWITICGNVLNNPEWRRTTTTGSVVVNFKILSTERRYSRDAGDWVDGNTLRVRVTCWRRLAEGVGASVKIGDPVIVYGKLYTREWEDDGGNKRLSYELEAASVGHDLSRGRAQFVRVKAAPGTSMVEDVEAEARTGGELTAAMSPDEIPVPPPGDLDEDELDSPAWRTLDPVASLRASGVDPVPLDGPVAPAADRWSVEGWSAGSTSTVESPAEEGDESVTADEPEAGGSRRRRGRSRVAVPA